MNNSLNAVGTKVAYILLKQEALLLPDAYDTFCECFEEEAEQNLPAEVSPNNLVTKQHLLSYLKAKLGKHLTYVTKIKSAGILLYRTGGDTLLSLTKALSQHRKSKQNGISQPHCSVRCTADSFDSQLVQVCTKMNNRLHVEAKQVIQKDKSSQIDLTTFNVERFMSFTSSIDPSILKMVVLSAGAAESPLIHLYQSYHTPRNFAASTVCVYCSSAPTTSVVCLSTFCSQILLTAMVEQLS